MRIYDDRYERERLRFHVALRFIRLEARTHTIRQWTGLSDDRIRKLYRSYLATDASLARHRGRSPERVAVFLRTPRLRQETALLASLCRLTGALPPCGSGGFALPLPSPARGQLLCHAYDAYMHLVSEPLLGFEHAVFLLSTLAQAQELRCERCRDCHAMLITDCWSLAAPRCTLCAAEALAEGASLRTGSSAASAVGVPMPLPVTASPLPPLPVKPAAAALGLLSCSLAGQAEALQD